MLQDHRGLSVSTTSATSLAHFERALEQFHAYRGDPIATLDAAVADDEAFVLAHLFRAFLLATTGEGRHLPAARAAVARAPLAHSVLASAAIQPQLRRGAA